MKDEAKPLLVQANEYKTFRGLTNKPTLFKGKQNN